MIYPLQRPVQPVFNSAAAIRNTLTLDFDGDVKEAWKLLCVKRPHCLDTHAHAHTYDTCTHTCRRDYRNIVYRALKDFYQKHFTLSYFF